MKIQLIETMESDGNWLKVKVDNLTKACICVDLRSREEALEKAEKIYQFYVNNNGMDKIIKEVEL